MSEPYQCPRCGKSPLRRIESAFACGGCGNRYPVRSGVPLFIERVEAVPSGLSLPEELLGALCVPAGLEPSPEAFAGLREVFAWNYELPDFHAAAENNYFFNRVPLPDDLKRPPLSIDRSRFPVNVRVRYAVDNHLAPDVLQAGRRMTVNVRLRNAGDSLISSTAAPGVCLATRWRDTAGRLVPVPAEPTRLPVELYPGRAMTVPAWVRVPDAPGLYLLEMGLLDGDRWLADGSRPVGVRVVVSAPDPVPADWQRPAQSKPYDYVEDHHAARDLLRDAVVRLARPGLRVLEVGGCHNPMARGLPGEVYSVDVDVQTLQVGQLRVGTGEPLQFVCADAHELPFADGSFDVAVLFASLHHFHDPVRCLTGLRRVLKRDGLLAIMCEPVGVYHDGHVSEEFRRELEQGINEQIFTAEEYAWMFGRAGLYVTWAEIDRGSFKAFLTPDVPEPAMAPLPRVGGWRVLARRVRERLRRMKARLLGRQSA